MLQVHFDKGALVLSHNSLTNIGIALELEANYGLGRDALIDLHTLVLRCNQLQVKLRQPPVPVSQLPHNGGFSLYQLVGNIYAE